MMLLHSFPSTTDLTPITQALWRHKVPHRVRFVAGEQQLWLQDAGQYADAQALMQQVLQGAAGQSSSVAGSEGPIKSSFMATSTLSSTLSNTVTMAWFKATPITFLVFLAMLLVALGSQLGSDLRVVAWFSFFPIVVNAVVSAQAYLVAGFDHLWSQPWRLISPMLLHFGWLHLVFNGMWWLDLGRRIEHQSKVVLVSLLVVTSLGANVAQAWQEISLFGGMSGVVYGLLGYIWVMDRYNAPRYHLPQSILIFMLLWLLLGLSDLLLVLGFGAIANMAHIGGLVAGVGWGFLHTFLLRIGPINR